MRKQCHRKERPGHTPVMPETWTKIATDMHTALQAMHTNPGVDVYDTLAGVFSAVSVAIKDNHDRSRESKVINHGSRTLIAAAAAVLVGAPLRPAELGALTRAVRTIDALFPTLDFVTFRAAEATAVAVVRSKRARTFRQARDAQR